MRRKFGQPVNIVLFSGTHKVLICRWDGVPLINPGNRHSPGALGTIGLLETAGKKTAARIINLQTRHPSEI